MVFIGMRVTLWKHGLFIINRAENKRLYIYQYCFLLVLKTVGLLKYFCMIFEYFVFSTVYIQNLFSGVHPSEQIPSQTNKCACSVYTHSYQLHPIDT